MWNLGMEAQKWETDLSRTEQDCNHCVTFTNPCNLQNSCYVSLALTMKIHVGKVGSMQGPLEWELAKKGYGGGQKLHYQDMGQGD